MGGDQNSYAATEAEDELSAPVGNDWTTPRHHLVQKASLPTRPTPYNNLRQLAGLIRRSSTPIHRKSSHGALARDEPPSVTPHTRSRRPPVSRRPLQPVSGNRSNPSTPHAIRALQQRRATPGHDRRKSGRLQRETPRDALRNLSRVLARTTEPSKPPRLLEIANPKIQQPAADDGSEDELSPEQPRLLLTISQTAENDINFDDDALPPRLSIPLEGEEQTVRSTEIPRRAEVRRSISRRSSGDVGLSDRSVKDHWIRASDATKLNIDYGSISPLENEETNEETHHVHPTDQGEDTGDLRKLMLQDSDMRQARFGKVNRAVEDGSSPFVLHIPSFNPRLSNEALREEGALLKEDRLQSGDAAEFLEENQSHVKALATPIAVDKPTARIAQFKQMNSRKAKPPKYSRHRIAYPMIPSGITKALASTLVYSSRNRKSRLDKLATKAIAEAGELFLEQLGCDLGSVSKHARRKIINENDVIAVMRRQRQLSLTATAFSLAQNCLPRELVQGLRVPPAKPVSRRKRSKLASVREEPENEADIL